jgi:hypothetical protein
MVFLDGFDVRDGVDGYDVRGGLSGRDSVISMILLLFVSVFLVTNVRDGLGDFGARGFDKDMIFITVVGFHADLEKT